MPLPKNKDRGLLTYRWRSRNISSPKPGISPNWNECQVIRGSMIVARFDTEAQAKTFIKNHKKEAAPC